MIIPKVNILPWNRCTFNILKGFAKFSYLKYGDPCNTNIIKWSCVIEWVWSVGRAVVIVLIPVYTVWVIHNSVVFKGAMTLRTVQVVRLDIRAFAGAAVFDCRADKIGNMEGWLVKRWPVISETINITVHDMNQEIMLYWYWKANHQKNRNGWWPLVISKATILKISKCAKLNSLIEDCIEGSPLAPINKAS